jgi:hypothetical protein
VEMSGLWLSIQESMPLLELLAAAYFAARDRQQPETFGNQGLALRRRRGHNPPELVMRD